MLFEKGEKGFDMIGDYFRLCKKWEKFEVGKNEETILDEAIADMLEFCKKYAEKNDRFAVNLAAALFQEIDDNVRTEIIIGRDKGSLRITALWLEELLRINGGKQ